MVENEFSLLEFIGGPFDGFAEEVATMEELPPCVALPLTQRASRLFGVRLTMSESHRVAIYKLSHCDGIPRYRFHRTRITNSAERIA